MRILSRYGARYLLIIPVIECSIQYIFPIRWVVFAGCTAVQIWKKSTVSHWNLINTQRHELMVLLNLFKVPLYVTYDAPKQLRLKKWLLNDSCVTMQFDNCAVRMDGIVRKLFCLTHWGRDKMSFFSQTTLSNAFSWMKMLEFRLRFHWSLFLRFQLTLFQHCFR